MNFKYMGQQKKRYQLYYQQNIGNAFAINYFNQKIAMADENVWCQESDDLLKYLYADLHIFNWSLISKELKERTQVDREPAECMERYVRRWGPVTRDEWSPEEEKELYRLHNQNGNKWAVISQNLLGRNDNSVKNHFYSKLRKSLRTLNKIAKLYLKKEAKQISDVVLYKLTQVTDQSLKQQTDLPANVITLSYQLKNKLLDYDLDQKNIRDDMDYTLEKEILNGLTQFNKIYKKKPKKEKVSVLGIQNIRKYREAEAKNCKKVKVEESESLVQALQRQISEVKGNETMKDQKEEAKRKFSDIYDMSNNFFGVLESYHAFKSQSECSGVSRPRRTLNVLIKAPSEEERDNYHRNNQLKSSCSLKQADNKNPSRPINPQTANDPSSALNRQKNKVEDILKAEGILQNGEYRTQNYFRRTNSVRSFSMCSQSSNPDMFGEDIIFLGGAMKELSELDQESQIFNAQSNQ